jgi:hypothetical protein
MERKKTKEKPFKKEEENQIPAHVIRIRNTSFVE